VSSQARLHTGNDAIQIAAAGKNSDLGILKLRYVKRGEDGVVEVGEMKESATSGLCDHALAFSLSG
jgi:hypothetical protein